ncbi:response regulator [Rhizobium mulingense]|uniref:response regulator n=1 Tax=Rhizobium mulingense TaxID=3031128 RepID=UPI002B45E975|nr:response regulator [Rhizobium sp. MJ21]MEB3047472.1 response regulator [Rhizobium sp. MJ21]
MAANQTAIRILIVEDEYLVALYLEDLLTEMGHRVLYSASRINEALHLARTCEIDFAVLDVNLAGTQSFTVAQVPGHSFCVRDRLRKRWSPRRISARNGLAKTV